MSDIPFLFNIFGPLIKLNKYASNLDIEVLEYIWIFFYYICFSDEKLQDEILFLLSTLENTFFDQICLKKFSKFSTNFSKCPKNFKT